MGGGNLLRFSLAVVVDFSKSSSVLPLESSTSGSSEPDKVSDV